YGRAGTSVEGRVDPSPIRDMPLVSGLIEPCHPPLNRDRLRNELTGLRRPEPVTDRGDIGVVRRTTELLQRLTVEIDHRTDEITFIENVANTASRHKQATGANEQEVTAADHRVLVLQHRLAR